jgi:hypothetical protein
MMDAMSTAAPAEPPLSRPGLIDYFVLLLGCALSVALFPLGVLQVHPPDSATPTTQAVVQLLLNLLRLPEGIILMWPVLHMLQRAWGRKQALAVGEWLWVAAWLGTAGLLAYAACYHSGVLAPLLHTSVRWPFLMWYLVVLPALAVIALCIAAFEFFRTAPGPWTHPLGLVLVIWPVLPLAGLLLLGKFS